MEIFKDIDGYVGYYQISNYGKIKNIKTNKIIKGSIVKSGRTSYNQVELYKDTVHKTKQVHRLVTIAFIPNPHNKPQVNHLDSNGLNNHHSNLEWSTQKENMKHGYEDGNVSENIESMKISNIARSKNKWDKNIGKTFGGIKIISISNYNPNVSGVVQCLHCGKEYGRSLKQLPYKNPYGCKSCSAKNRKI